MPQSSAASRLKAEALRLLRAPHATAAAVGSFNRPVWAKRPLVCKHGTCLAVLCRDEGLQVLVRDAAGQDAWAPVARILSPDERGSWARGGFG